MPVCNLNQCDYVVPENYNPLYGQYKEDGTRNGADRAKAVFKNCMVLAFKESFYVGAQGRLEGYSWLNFPGRVFLWAKNWWSGGKIYNNATTEIEETFEFILGIRKKVFYINDAEGELACTSFYYSMKYSYPYTRLAEKVIENYPRETHQKLYNLAHRILHERPIRIEVQGQKRMNIDSCAKGTPYARTTVWGFTDV